MEAIEQNPVMYELMTEIAWRSEHFDVAKWLDDYSHRRYGNRSTSAMKAWKVLHKV
jgi:alpha-N-acetylglucosaminidase